MHASISVSESGIGGSTRRKPMKHRLFTTSLLVILSSGAHAFAQAPDGPQTDPPTPASRPAVSPTPRAAGNGQTNTVPSGTRIGVTLENGISTYSAEAR